VHALGLVLYEAISGERTYKGKTVVEMAQTILDTRFVPLEALKPDVPMSVARIVGRTLLAMPATRPPAAELARDLDHVTRVLRGGTKVVAAKEIRTFALAFRILGAIAVLLGAALVAIVLWPRGDPEAARREAIGTLSEVAKASLGTSDLEALLASQTALGLAAETSDAVSWELLSVGSAGGARPRRRRGRDRPSRSARSSSRRPSGATTCASCGRAAASRRATRRAALEDLVTLATPEALRLLRAGAPPGEALRGARDAQGRGPVRHAGALGRARNNGQEAHRVGPPRALAGAAPRPSSRSSTRERRSTRSGSSPPPPSTRPSSTRAPSTRRPSTPNRSSARSAASARPSRALACSTARRTSPRSTAPLAVIERGPAGINPSNGGAVDAGDHWKVVETITRDLEAVALKLAGEGRLAALSHRVRAARILDQSERGVGGATPTGSRSSRSSSARPAGRRSGGSATPSR